MTMTTQSAERERGRIKWFDPHKGYGFITTDTGSEIFAHGSQFAAGTEPASHDKVEFTPAMGRDRRPYARSVKIILED